MRVSRAFKLLAAPFLYEELDWKHMARDPLKLVREGHAGSEQSWDIVAKNIELRHIKTIELQQHPTGHCPLKGDSNRLIPLNITTLRIVMRNTEWSRKHCLRDENCALVGVMSANKVVVSTDCSNHGVRLNQYNGLSSGDQVMKLDLRQKDLWDPRLHSQSRAKRLIVILSLATWDVQFHPLQFHNEAIRNCQSKMAKEMADDIIYGRPSREMVMVNFDALATRLVSPAADTIETFESIFKKTFDDRLASSPLSEFEAGLPSVKFITPVRFITMKDYLTEYDWNGVYTEEEVAGLLEEQDWVDE